MIVGGAKRVSQPTASPERSGRVGRMKDAGRLPLKPLIVGPFVFSIHQNAIRLGDTTKYFLCLRILITIGMPLEG